MSQGRAYTKEQREIIIESLEYYLKLGYSRNKACAFIGLDPTTLSKWVVNDEALSMKLNGWESYVNTRARENIVNKIVKDKDVEQSKWWSERREKGDFSTRTENTGADGEALPILVKFLNGNSNNRDTQ